MFDRLLRLFDAFDPCLR